MVFAAPPLFTCKPIVIRGHMFTLFEWEQNQNLEILEKNNYTKHGFLFIKHILFKNTLIISAFSASTNFSPFTHINAYSFLFTLHYTLTLNMPFQLPVLSITITTREVAGLSSYGCREKESGMVVLPCASRLVPLAYCALQWVVLSKMQTTKKGK